MPEAQILALLNELYVGLHHAAAEDDRPSKVPGEGERDCGSQEPDGVSPIFS
jgi:hypothetical protein